MTGRNAAASAFGWDFQHNAAIVLVLKNLNAEFKSVKVEGATEDIEINYIDGRTSYIQAKASQKPENDKNVKAKFEKALTSLNDAAKQTNVKSLVYTTNNHIYPFKYGENDPYINGRNTLKYRELGKKSKSLIDKIIKDKGLDFLDVDNLSVEIIPFYGDDDENRYKEAYKSVEDFLSVNKTALASKRRIVEKLQSKFQKNATKQDVKIVLTKEKIVWYIIAVVCDDGRELLSDELIETEFEGNYSLFDSVKEKYNLVIEDSTNKFQLISNVMSEFQKQRTLDCKLKTKEFIINNWNRFVDFFPDVEPDLQKMLILIVLERIFRNQKIISDIKNNVGGV